MVNTSNPLGQYIIAENLRQCILERIENSDVNPIKRSCVVTGEVAWDDCECGQLIVAIQRSYPSGNFPEESPDTENPCGAPIQVVEYLVSMTRCSPVGGDDPNPPACEDLAAAARLSVEDAWAVTLGLRCCLSQWVEERDPETNGNIITDFQLNEQRYTGGEGMCQGSDTTVLVGILNACFSCDDES